MWKFQISLPRELGLKHVPPAWQSKHFKQQGARCQTTSWTGHVKVYANQLCPKISFLQTSKQMSFMLSV